MRAIVKRKANAALAAMVSLLCAISLLGTPAMAQADEATDNAPSKMEIFGVDYMETGSFGWELLRIENGENQTIYMDVLKDGQYLVRNLSYKVPASDANAEGAAVYEGTGSPLAHIVALQMKKENGDPAAVKDLLGAKQRLDTPGKDPSYTIVVHDAPVQGETLFEGVICPIYAKLDKGDDAASYQLLGIRTVDTGKDAPSPSELSKNAGVGATCYENLGADSVDERVVYGLQQAENGADVAFENGAFVATYKLAKDEAVTGVINYVDLDGAIVRTVDMGPIPAEGLDKPFDRAFVEGNVYYRAINNLKDNTVHLTTLQPTKQIRVVKVADADAGLFTVKVEYWASEDLDKNGDPKDGKEDAVLWTDTVAVKGGGYQYTLPNTFSTTKKSGIEFYTLSAITPEGAASEVRNEAERINPVVQLNAETQKAMKQNKDEEYVLRAIYDSQETTKEVALTIYEYNGETGQLIGDPRGTKLTVKEGQPATYTPSAKTVNGQTLVPWSGNMEPITYEWADLQKGTDLVQRVYYVPEGYTPGDTYDITVQYMNIATSQVLRTQTIAVDPEANDFVNILGEERFVEGGNEYVRLNGQETAIRHAYFTPTRTYTIYYRDVNDELSSQITVQRTQIIDTERVVTVPGTTVITAAPAAVAADGGDDGAAAPAGAAPAGAAAPVVDAGVGAGDGTTIINDDDNPLANFDGTTTTQERIEDDATALSSGEQNGLGGVNAVAGTAAAIAAVALLGLAVLLVWRMRRKKAADNGSMGQ